MHSETDDFDVLCWAESSKQSVWLVEIESMWAEVREAFIDSGNTSLDVRYPLAHGLFPRRRVIESCQLEWDCLGNGLMPVVLGRLGAYVTQRWTFEDGMIVEISLWDGYQQLCGQPVLPSCHGMHDLQLVRVWGRRFSVWVCLE